MSGVILTAGKLVFAAMGIAVGFKLAGTLRERGAFGLHTVALGAICTGGVGLLLMPLAQWLGSIPLNWLAEAGVRAGMLLLCVFIAGTFRPNAVGWIAAALAGTFLVAAIAIDLRTQGALAHYDYTSWTSHANQLSIAIPFVWATLESATLYLRGRRRLQLGLADPVVVHGYLLWAITCASFVGICTLAIAGGLLSAAGHEGVAGYAHGLRGVLYFVLTTAIWLGLFRKAPQPGARAAA